VSNGWKPPTMSTIVLSAVISPDVTLEVEPAALSEAAGATILATPGGSNQDRAMGRSSGSLAAADRA
jgi:hypothetical protein